MHRIKAQAPAHRVVVKQQQNTTQASDIAALLKLWFRAQRSRRGTSSPNGRRG